MNIISSLYQSPLALTTDFYQLTSAYAFWKAGQHERRAVYHMFFRSLPFGGGYAIAAGLQYVRDWILNTNFRVDDLQYLSKQQGNDGKPLFESGFLEWLSKFKFTCNVDAVPEGTVVFPHEPLVRVEGTIVENLLIETFCLTVINSQTLFATKAARVCEAAQGDPVLEFGLRRAQGIDGGIAASRAAYIGGCTATSNVEAGRLFGIPIKGTHPHGLVMFHDTEVEAFEMYANAMPNNVVFLVDTYNTLEGVKHAIEVFQKLVKRGHSPIGIRLDSGDLAYLSIAARKLLDDARLPNVKIFASNDLDEHKISSLKQQGAKIDVWGVGTKLVTAYDQPALGGVYKMGAIKSQDGQWQARIKLSEQVAKTSCPGVLDVLRFRAPDTGHYVGDMIFDKKFTSLPPRHATMIDLKDPTRRQTFDLWGDAETLLQPILLNGQATKSEPTLTEIRNHARAQLANFPGVRRLKDPHEYSIGLELMLNAHRMNMTLKQQA